MHSRIDHYSWRLQSRESMNCFDASLLRSRSASSYSWSRDQWRCLRILLGRIASWSCSKCLLYEFCSDRAIQSLRWFSRRWLGCPCCMLLLYLLNMSQFLRYHCDGRSVCPCTPSLSDSTLWVICHLRLCRIGRSLCRSKLPIEWMC